MPQITLIFLVQILIIGHHILHGKEQKLEKPFAVLRKQPAINDPADADADNADVTLSSACSQALLDQSAASTSQSTTLMGGTVLETTVAIEHKTAINVEFRVQAIVTKRLVFKSRPKPIIANVAKHV